MIVIIKFIEGVVIGKMPDDTRDMSFESRSITFSPCSILSSLKKRKRPSERGRKRKMLSRNRYEEGISESRVPVSCQYEATDRSPLSTTNWVEVVFLRTSQARTDVYNVQGGRRDSVGVTIYPEWRPPSPPPRSSTSSVEACSPKRLLPTSIIKYTEFYGMCGWVGVTIYFGNTCTCTCMLVFECG